MSIVQRLTGKVRRNVRKHEAIALDYGGEKNRIVAKRPRPLPLSHSLYDKYKK